MSELAVKAYLQRVLALEPEDSAAEMLRMRWNLLAPSELLRAELSGSSSEEFRTQMLHQLHELRRDFWWRNEVDVRQLLDGLKAAAIPEITVAALRLQQVFEQRNAVGRLRSDPRGSARFLAALVEILVAPTSTANQLRDREHRWMRPEQNPQHAAARQAIVMTVQLIRDDYPGVFALEETWFGELTAYNPEDEQVDEGSNTLFGLAVVACGLLTIVAQIGLIRWMFT